MADKKAGTTDPKVRQTMSDVSVLVFLQFKVEEFRRKITANRRRAKSRRTKAAAALGVAQAAPKKVPASASPSKRQKLLRFLIAVLILLALLGAALMIASWLIDFIKVDGTAVLPASVSTAIPPTNSAAVIEPTVVPPQAGDVYLRVETLQLDPASGTLSPLPGVEIFFAPYVEGKEMYWPEEPGRLDQTTEELVTVDGVTVAATTFKAQPGLYMVWTRRYSGECEIWVPRFAEDDNLGIDTTITRSVVVNLRFEDFSDYNTTVIKFQFVCGLEVSVSPTSVVPASTPIPTNPPPTNPPPTEPPPPTPVPTEVICNCDTPSTPVPPPTPMDVTATPSR